jgi:flavin-dependent dehydrogenase
MHDVIVIGARCAGAPTAMLLARKGYKVLLVDRGTFPSDIPHGHFIHRHGPRRLAHWGLLDRITATNCPAATSSIMDLGDFPLAASGLVVDGIALGYGPRRTVLDQVLVTAAVEAGAELRTGFTVDDFIVDGDRIAGIRGRTSGGGSTTESASIVVGADGRRSRLARFVEAPEYESAPTAACWYFSYWSGMPDPGVEIYFRRDAALFVFPTNDLLTGIFVGWPIHRLPIVRADIEGHFMASIDAIPSLSERVRAGRREEPFKGATDMPNFFRKPYGPGWALVGDAGCHKDPILALGVCDAFRDVDLLTDALDAGLSGRRPMGDVLHDYEQRRNEASMAEYRENLHLARFQPFPEETYRLRAALREDPDATKQFFLARQGMIPRESFFNRDNLQRLMALCCLLMLLLWPCSARAQARRRFGGRPAIAGRLCTVARIGNANATGDPFRRSRFPIRSTVRVA